MLNALRKERNVGWDALVIEAVCAHYGLDKLVMVLPRVEKPAKQTNTNKKGGKHGKEKTVKEKAAETTTDV